MKKIHTSFWKSWFSVMFFVFCIECGHADVEPKGSHDFLIFERMKNELLTRSNEKLVHYTNSTNVLMCLRRLRTVATAITKFELWAEKFIDSWGKLPSGILDGNVYGFGSFSECFHIDRNGELFKTKYCMGQVKLPWDDIPKSKYSKSEFIPQPANGSVFTFGICLPIECSEEFLQKHFMEQDTPLPVTLIENSCQIEEYPSNLTPLDWIAIATFVTILTIILMSTTYDIYCTINNLLLSCESPKSKNVIRCLDGIRAITAAWILYGHVTKMFFRLPISNKVYIETFHSRYINLILLSMQIGVDTFFTISGLLIAINTLNLLEKKNGKLNIPQMFLHRYLRLTPLLAIIILSIMSILQFMGSGPVWTSVINDIKIPCDKKWWSALLYIQNYVEPEKMCLSASWYLSVDMQLYIISPLIIYLIYRYNKKTIYALIILVLGCIGCTIAVHLKYGYKLGLIRSSKSEAVHAYYPTHIRYSPWLVGVIAGYIFYKSRNKVIQIPKMLNFINFSLSLVTINAVIFGFYPLAQTDSTNTRLEYGLYFALSRVGWSIALCYIIFACHHNHGGPVNWILGHRLWQPLSRLSYSTYLIQYPVLYAIMGTTMNSVYFTERTCFLTAVQVYIITVFISMIATLAFEMPFLVISKLMVSSKNRHQHKGNDVGKST